MFTDLTSPVIYTLSLHDALPISIWQDTIAGNKVEVRHGRLWRIADFQSISALPQDVAQTKHGEERVVAEDRKSTRLNSSHTVISYAVFCLKKKNNYNAA